MPISTTTSFARVYHTVGEYARTSLSDTIHGDIRTSLIVKQGTENTDRDVTLELRGVDPLAPRCSINFSSEDLGSFPHPSNWSDGAFEVTGQGRSGLYDTETLREHHEPEDALLTLTFERTSTDQKESPVDVHLTHRHNGVRPISTHFNSTQAADLLNILDEVARATSRETFLDFLKNDTASFVDASGNKHPLSLFKQLPKTL